MNARMSHVYWGALPSEAEVFDPHPYRAMTLFGRPFSMHTALRQPLPEFEALLGAFTPARAAEYGFDYLYIDGEWWWRLAPAQRETFEQSCVLLLDEFHDHLGDFRRLYDVHPCVP